MDGPAVQKALPGEADAGIALAHLGGWIGAVDRASNICRWEWRLGPFTVPVMRRS
jgi:hypothetical protein